MKTFNQDSNPSPQEFFDVLSKLLSSRRKGGKFSVHFEFSLSEHENNGVSSTSEVVHNQPSEEEKEEEEQELPDEKACNSSNVFRKCYSLCPQSGKPNTKPISFMLLRNAVRKHCLPFIKQKCHWFCLWRVLSDLKLLKTGCQQSKFIALMQEWFPLDGQTNCCSKNCLHVYMPTYLGRFPWREWEEEKYLNDIQTRKKAKTEAFSEFREICTLMDAGLRKHFVELL